MKRIVCLQGSPRRDGNSAVLAAAFCTAAEEQGATVDRYWLYELSFRGCVNLFECKTGADRCGQKDDLTQVLVRIEKADVVVLATPVYFTDVSGPMKSCIDRWFSYFVPDYVTATKKSRLADDKTLVFIQTQGEGEDRYRDLLDRYNHSFDLLGFRDTILIRAPGTREAGAIHNSPAVIAEAEALGRRLAN